MSSYNFPYFSRLLLRWFLSDSKMQMNGLRDGWFSRDIVNISKKNIQHDKKKPNLNKNQIKKKKRKMRSPRDVRYLPLRGVS